MPESHNNTYEDPPWLLRTIGFFSIALGSVAIVGGISAMFDVNSLNYNDSPTIVFAGAALIGLGSIPLSKVRASKELRKAKRK